NIDESSMASSAVGGGVGAATMSVLAPATVLQALAAGGAAGWLSGRASALTEASWNQAAALLSGQGLNGEQFLTAAMNAGIIDPTSMIADTATGSVIGGAGKLLSGILPQAGTAKSPGGPPMVVMQPDGSLGIQISGRPGLHLTPTQAQRLMYALTNGLMY